jgi:hypothetical protein
MLSVQLKNFYMQFNLSTSLVSNVVDLVYWSLLDIYLINCVKISCHISKSHFYVLVLTEDIVALIVQKMLIVSWP